MLKRLKSKIAYRSKWMTVRDDDVLYQNGQKGMFNVIERRDFSLIVPFEKPHLYLVKQFRYPIGQETWEFPHGRDQNNSQMDPLEVAKLELREETGFKGQLWEKIGYFHVAPGYSTQGFTIFFVTGLKAGKQQLETSEADMVMEKFTINQFEEMVTSGKITDAITISVFVLLKIKALI